MKCLYLMTGLLFFALFGEDSEIASKGAVTEALFIVKNKQKELQQVIQGLKKELTECYLIKKDSTKSRIRREQELAQYHCHLKRLLYPASIAELEALEAQNKRAIDLLSQDESIKSRDLDTWVHRAFLMREKTELERQLISMLFDIDCKTCELNNRSVRTKKVTAHVRRHVLSSKKRIRNIKRSLKNVNHQLYHTEEIPERTYFDALLHFK